MKKTRGIRNNNPLNIRRNETRWQGLREEQTDKAFLQFSAPEWGYRAAIKTLRTYQSRYGLTTVRQMVSRWAPPCENDTDAYISAVERRAKIRESAEVDLSNEEVTVRLVEAMSFVENGVPGVLEDIKKGFKLAKS